MDMIAKFVKRMSTMPDFGGTNLIDNTVITLSSPTCPNGTTTPTSPTW